MNRNTTYGTQYTQNGTHPPKHKTRPTKHVIVGFLLLLTGHLMAQSTLPPEMPLTELRQMAAGYISTAETAAQQARKKAEASAAQRDALAEQVAAQKKDSTIAAADKKTLAEALKAAQKTAKQDAAHADKVEKGFKAAEKMFDMDSVTLRKALEQQLKSTTATEKKAKSEAIDKTDKPKKQKKEGLETAAAPPKEKKATEEDKQREKAPKKEKAENQEVAAAPEKEKKTKEEGKKREKAPKPDETTAETEKKSKKTRERNTQLPEPERPLTEIVTSPQPSSTQTPKHSGTQNLKHPNTQTPKPLPPLKKNAPVPECAIVQNRRDQFTGAIYREVQAAELFRFTNNALKKALGNTPHIRCEAALASDDNSGTLWLTFYINDPNGRKSFGNLPKASPLILEFMDGTLERLFNQTADEGSWDKTGTVLTYRGQYTFDKAFFKKLQKSELDRLRVSWGTGYEDYSVYIIDLLQQQTACLNR